MERGSLGGKLGLWSPDLVLRRSAWFRPGRNHRARLYMTRRVEGRCAGRIV